MTFVNCHFSSSRRYSLLVACLVGLVFSSCQKNSDNKDLTKDYYDNVLATVAHRYGAYYDDKAFNYLDSSYRHARKLSVMERFKFYDFYCGYYYHARKDYLKAMAYADSMVLVIEQSNRQEKMMKQYAQAHYSKGDVYFITGNYEDAYKYYFKSKIIARDLDKCTSSEYNYRLGMALFKQKRFSSAADNFKSAFNESAVCKNDFAIFWRRQELLNNAALSYAKANMPDSALVYYSKALQFIELNEPLYQTNALTFRTAKGVVYGNMGDIYMQKGDLAAAEKLFKQSIESNSAPLTDLNDGQLTRIKLAQLYIQQNNAQAFHQTLNNIKGGMDSIHNADVKMNWNGLMSNYYINLDEPRKAFEHLLTYNELRDSIQLSNQALLSEDAITQLLRLETEYEIDLLKKNSRLQSVYLGVAILFTLLVLVIVFLVYKNGQRSKHSVKELKNLNDQINQQNDALEATLASLEHSSNEKDRILRAVAHDLRNPVGGIAAVSGMMLETAESGAEQHEMLSLIQNASNDTLTLINELLEAAEGEHLEPAVKQWIDVNTLVTNNVDLLQFKAQEKNQRIKTDLPAEHHQVLINREKINRVIGNLISNAIKFSPDGTDIVVKAFNRNKHVVISVSDKGIGIPNKLKERVFDMFTTAKRPGTAGEKPFGLGLYISNEIVKAHGGRLWFENNEDAGVTFFVELGLSK